MSRPNPAMMPMVARSLREKAEAEKHSRAHGVTNSTAYQTARRKAGLK